MSENMSEKTANKTYWWRFNHEHARHTRHFKPIYWGLFSVGGTIAALALAPIIIVLCTASITCCTTCTTTSATASVTSATSSPSPSLR